MGIIERLYFIDFIILALCLKVVFTAVERGVVNELFKTTGLVCGAWAAFHYYTYLAAKAEANLSFFNKKYLYFAVFLFILAGILLIFSVLRKIVAFFYEKEEISVGERWISFVAGGFRCAFLASIIFFLLSLYSFNQEYYCRSVSYKLFRNIAPKIYVLSLDVFNSYKGDSVNQGNNEEVKKYLSAEIKRK